MPAKATISTNGFWLRVLAIVVGGVLVATVVATAGTAWSHHARIAQSETRDKETQRRLATIEADVKELLRLARRP